MQPPTAQPPTAQQQIDPNEPITLTDAASNQPVQILYKTIFDGIRKKVSQNAGPKYKEALTALKNSTPDKVASILNDKGISFKNNQIMGGRKTKKINKKHKKNKTRKMKQKGGYTYKHSSKRKSISTASSVRSSRKRR
jgi:hypothetical protein